ncbi:MAG: thiamine diphosphokinase [Firmicutes bacterium]|jgi:thiamine pyrophosphokinase|nr:thiamine diphosphokinase [Bacillota bacterium]HOB22488.1 thiamine diphosphokinase [Bacillota bacterium]HQD39833.1 thiamine diphosphokinase [Bacillota bacterium]
MVKKAILVAGGSLSQPPSIAQEDLVIAIDSGLEHCLRFQITPQLVLGDLDSVSEGALRWAKARQLKILTFPREKDKTDTHLAVEYAISQGAEEIQIHGGIGSRFDHTLANAHLLMTIARQGAQGMLTDGEQKIFLLEEELCLMPEKEMCFSILPLSFELSGLSIEGAFYPLENAAVSLGDTRTISNEFLDKPVKLTLKAGCALVCVCPRL